jgi:hypothetical protein
LDLHVDYERASDLTVCRGLYVGCALLCALVVIVFGMWSRFSQPTVFLFVGILGMVHFCAGGLTTGFELIVSSAVSARRSQDRSGILFAGDMTIGFLGFIFAVSFFGTSVLDVTLCWSTLALVMLVASFGACVALYVDVRSRKQRTGRVKVPVATAS